MATASNPATNGQIDSELDRSGLGGHPRGLTTLFFTEMWERFSYYGMRALLVLYMTTAVAGGGLGLDTKTATGIYGAYTGSVYLMSIPGGWIADNVLGARRSVLWGGIIIALGHYSMAVPSIYTFFPGLVLIVLGTGLLKPNVSAIVGSLYSETDPRRDAGFSIFYMGINLGAFIAPLICSYLGEKIDWHLGFGAAGIGMTLGIIQYIAGRDRLAGIGEAPAFPKEMIKRNAIRGVLFMALSCGAVGFLWFGPEIVQKNKMLILISVIVLFLVWLFTGFLKTEEKKPVAVIVILFLFSIIFWATFEQAGSSFNLFADRFTDRSVPASIQGLLPAWLQSQVQDGFPAGWFQSVNSIFLIALAPVFSWLWMKMGENQPSSPAKFSIGLFFVGVGALVLMLASGAIAGPGSTVSPMWLIGVYLAHTIGELCLSPVGLSTTTKLAPARLSGLMMGVWFLSISFGNFFAGEVAGEFGSKDALISLFGKVATGPVIAAIILLALTPSIRKLMGKVR
ncbi:MAG: peptide MFS transporter [Acidobacteria bacterium]|nr:peptide MFS transporter [Acidobacteriota bacterium]